MGVSSQPSLVPLSFKDLVKRADIDETKNSSFGNLVMKMMDSKRKMAMSEKSKRNKRRRGRIVMKRRARLMESSRRRGNKVERRVTKLKRLVPNGDESKGLDGLFRRTADYILTLQMRVKVMQVMVKVLTTTPSDL